MEFVRAAAPVRRRRRVRLADLSVAAKLALILALPLAGLLALTGFTASLYAGQSGRIGDLRGAVTAGAEAGRVADGLQRERLAIARLLAGDSARDTVAAQAARTDTAVTRFRAAAAHVEGSGPALAGLDGLAELRARAAAREPDAPAQVLLLGYRQLIADLVAFQQGIADRPAPPGVTTATRAEGWLAVAKEELALVHVAAARALAAGELTPADRDQLIAHRAAASDALERFAAAATPAWRSLLAGLDVTAHVEQLLLTPPAAADAGGTADWARICLAQLDGLRDLAERVAADNAATVTSARDEQNRTIILGLALVLALVAAAVGIAVATGRSLRRGLRALLRAPGHEPPAGGRDEAGRVTEALDAGPAADPRTAAPAGATGMYADLARRSGRLADALLERLDDAERDEADPDRLALLFAFDHLATRIRHNTHSLLVLAGAQDTRDHAAPVPLLDVLRAAQSQIQAYERVEYGSVEDEVTVEPAAVDGVVHLLAELLDNAATHSSPDRPVLVDARRAGDGAVIQVADHGPGADPARLAELNARLAEPNARLAEPNGGLAELNGGLAAGGAGPRLGLAVVARLAARHGLGVTLQPSAGQGLVAVLRLPSTVLGQAPPQPVPAVAARPLPPRVLERSPALPGAEPMDIPSPRRSGGRIPVVARGVAADGPTVEARAFDDGLPRRTVEASPSVGIAGPGASVEPEDVRGLLSAYQHAIGRFGTAPVPVPVNQEGPSTS